MSLRHVQAMNREVYFLNIPERGGRGWDEFRRLGYVSSVGCARTLDALSELTTGDHIAAYLRRCGYVGIGVVLGAARPVNGTEEEYRLPVRWMRAVERNDARWLPRGGLYASPQVKAAMAHRIETLRFLQDSFDITLIDDIGTVRGTARTLHMHWSRPAAESRP